MSHEHARSNPAPTRLGLVFGMVVGVGLVAGVVAGVVAQGVAVVGRGTDAHQLVTSCPAQWSEIQQTLARLTAELQATRQALADRQPQPPSAIRDGVLSSPLPSDSRDTDAATTAIHANVADHQPSPTKSNDLPCQAIGQVCSATEERVRQALETAFRQLPAPRPAAASVGFHVVQLDGQEIVDLVDDHGQKLVVGQGTRFVTELFDRSGAASASLASLELEVSKRRLPLASGTARVERRTWSDELKEPSPLRIHNPQRLTNVTVRYTWGSATAGNSAAGSVDFDALVGQASYQSLAQRLFRQTLSDGVRLRKEPSETSAVRLVLPAASWVRIFREEQGWMEVRSAEGEEGWIFASLLAWPTSRSASLTPRDKATPP